MLILRRVTQKRNGNRLSRHLQMRNHRGTLTVAIFHLRLFLNPQFGRPTKSRPSPSSNWQERGEKLFGRDGRWNKGSRSQRLTGEYNFERVTLI